MQQPHKRGKKVKRKCPVLIKCTLFEVISFGTIDVYDIPYVLFSTLYNQIFINLIGKIACILFL